MLGQLKQKHEIWGFFHLVGPIYLSVKNVINVKDLLIAPFTRLQVATIITLVVQWTMSQGSLLFSKFEFSIKPDLRDLSFLKGGLMQFFYKMQVVFFYKSAHIMYL